MSSSSPARVLGTGLASLIPTDGAADVDPVAAATGRRIVAQLSMLKTVAVPVAVVSAAVELLGLLASHPDPQAREAVEAVVL
ncbi:hypothetical protein [Kitasatospora phosalacinea]|uniref:Uncharacterized protein n=1 Tax=Kitasatospora phosalacinea TaxID=2065 RepID=A0A9W6PN77_9ACTN|nr:hypothetical protein [Kitasatospora phosalacinea]GLW58075.1 hypothetical protein Kpho01_60860 [Kitasatospora phosalacinea]